MKHPTYASLVTEGLGYCCPYFFTKFFWKTPRSVIALRLGCSDKTVYEQRIKMRKGQLPCPNAENCMKSRLNAAPAPKP